MKKFLMLFVLFFMFVSVVNATPIGSKKIVDGDNDNNVVQIDNEKRMAVNNTYTKQISKTLSVDGDNESTLDWTPGEVMTAWVVYNPSTTTDMYVDIDPSTYTTTNYMFIPRSSTYIQSRVTIPVKGETITVKHKRTSSINVRLTGIK